MTKLEQLNKEYEGLKGKELSNIILYIHMPTGETEVIVNPDVKNKIDYINKTYNENLIHSNCKDIYITEYLIVEENENGLDFGDAIAALKDGLKVTKKSWHKEGMFIQMQVPDEHSKMRGSYLYITIGEYTNPWTPSQADMLEEDWQVVE